MEKKILVERETYEKNGKTFFSYFVKGTLRGKPVKASMSPMDVGGYAVLDIVFGNAMAAELVITPYELHDEKSGRTISGNSYAVRSTDENGEVFECKIRPYRNSDKMLLQMLLK